MSLSLDMKRGNCYLLPNYTRMPVVFVRGKGMYLWDEKGEKYLDFFAGWAVTSVGHNNPYVVKKMKAQVDALIYMPNNYYSKPQVDLAEKIIQYSFPGKVFFSNSGAESNEGAIKLARYFGSETGRYEIITMVNSFHGRTLATLTATGQPKYQKGFKPLPKGFKYVPFGDYKAIENAITDKTIAIMLEPIQGEGGIQIADRAYFKKLRALCNKKNMLLIFDEVQTGMGRTGKMFCFSHYGIKPDVMTLAKSLGNGVPIGAIVIKNSLKHMLPPGTHASTFGGGALICAAALGVFEAIEKEKLLSHTQKMGNYLNKKLVGLQKKYPKIIKEVRGVGLMQGVELLVDGTEIYKYCFERKILINCTQGNILRLMPAMIVTKAQIDRVMKVLDKAFDA